LTNVVRHARARHVDVCLGVESGELRLEVRDDGVGIDARQIADPRSLGLLGMRERAHALDGDFEIAPYPDGGTLVTARIPLRSTSDRRSGTRRKKESDATDSGRRRGRQRSSSPDKSGGTSSSLTFRCPIRMGST
jgi:signal transduction histidine kinase